MQKKRYKVLMQFMCGLLLLLLLIRVYWSGLYGGFFFDDHVNILDNSSTKIDEISVNTLLNVLTSGVAGPWGRPISMLSFAMNYYFSGFDAFWFKFTNLLIHCLNTAFVYFLGVLIIRGGGAKERDERKLKLAALLIALLWAFHPMQLTSVLYVVQRMTSLSATFFLIAFVLHVWVRQRDGIHRKELFCLMLSWGLFFPLSVLCKETGVLFLLYIAVYEVTLSSCRADRIDRFSKLYLLAFGMAGALILIYESINYKTGLLSGYETRTFTLFQRILTESRIMWVYLKMIVFPVLSDFGLYHDDVIISKGFFSPITTILSFISFGGVFVLLWMIRHENRLFLFGALWFLAGHALESTIFPLELMHEHRNYLPSFGVLVAIGSILISDFMTRSGYKIAIYSTFSGFLIYFGLVTYLRADMYRDDFRRTQIETAYRMNSVRSNYEAGIVLVNIFDKYSEPALAGLARKHFEKVVSIDPDYRLALVGILKLECTIDKTQIKKVYDNLLDGLSYGKLMLVDRTVLHAIAVMSNDGTLCLNRIQMDSLFGQALENPSASAEDRSAMASDYALYLWLGQKDYLAAKNVMVDIIAANPKDILNRLNLLQLLRFLGDSDGVINSITDLNLKKISYRDERRLEMILSELVNEGVLKER